MEICIVDGLRHTNLTGYGALSRAIILGLAELDHQVYLQPRGDREWGKIERGARERLEAFETIRDLSKVDVILQIGTPPSCKAYKQPTLIYTQNALGDLPPDWVTALERADGCIVPSEFDRRVFKRHFDRVYVARQSSDPRIFRPEPARRAEGSDRFTFLFVGTYSYRKGIDLLLEAFFSEFDASEDIELVVHAAGMGADHEFNHLLSYLQRINPTAHIRLLGTPLSPEWMSRIYNRVDCVITLSRGEGWCMPLTEALLCETPVIAPGSTGMAEYLSDDVAYPVSVNERVIADIAEPFGAGFAKAYGNPGNVCYEPDVDHARRQMRAVVEDPEAARSRARAGRLLILEELNWPNAVREIESALVDLLCFDTAHRVLR